MSFAESPSLALVRGTTLHIMHHAYVVSKRRNFLSTDTVKKLAYLHGNLRNTSSCNRLTGASAKPGSSLLNCIRNKMLQELLSDLKTRRSLTV